MELTNSLQQFLQIALIGVIGFVVPVVAFQIWKWVKAKAAEVKAGMDVQQLYLFDQFVAIAVKAVEQAKLKENFEASAEQMLATAVGIVQSYLDSHGLSQFNVADIEAAIRAALRDGIQKADQDGQ